MSPAMITLPATCERALLERFLRAEAMALWAVRAAQMQNLPRHVQTFLQRHETDEQDHLRQFEGMLGTTSQRPSTLPTVPSQWEMLAVLLFGYEALGLEFATLLATIPPRAPRVRVALSGGPRAANSRARSAADNASAPGS